MMLQVRGLVVRYGSVAAVRGLSLEVAEGEMVALLGANGAGKSTLLMAIAGAHRPAEGDVLFEGRSIRSLNPEQTVARGVALVPERRRILATLTVGENLQLGATSRRDKSALKEDYDRLFERFPILGERRQQLAGQLSGGEQQQLAFARALMSRPRLLLCDEPSLGLSPILTDSVFELLAQLRGEGLTVLLVEQFAEKAVALADRAYVLTRGRVSLEGSGPKELSGEVLRDAYLGEVNGCIGEHSNAGMVAQ